MKKLTPKALIRLIGIGLLIFILFKIDWIEFKESLKQIKILPLIYSALLLLPLYIFKVLRWRYLLSVQQINYSFKNSFLAFLASNYIAFITPGRLGEVAKAFYVKGDLRINIAKSMPSVIFDRLFDVYVLLAVGLTGLIHYLPIKDFGIVFWIIIIFIIICPVFLLSKRLIFALLKSFNIINLRIKGKPVYGFLENFYKEVNILINFKLIIGLFLTLAAYGILYYSGLQMAHAINLNINYFTIAVFISVANILSFIPISVSGIGTREASLIYLFSLIGQTKEAAILFSTLLFFVFFIIGGIYGFIAYLIKPIDIKSVMRNRESG